MKILLYDYHELEERASKHLKIWKVWHTILYVVAAVFGILNFAFLESTMSLLDNHCILYPSQIEFHWTLLSTNTSSNNILTTTERSTENVNLTSITDSTVKAAASAERNDKVTETSPLHTNEDSASGGKAKRRKRDVQDHEFVTKVNETEVDERNATIITGNKTHRLTVDTMRTLFAKDSDCDFPQFMPIVSTVFTMVWLTLFIMCPGGGRSSNMHQPWRILTPALLFALVMVGLTGHSFSATNGGLHAFCAAFHNFTDSNACSAVNPYLELSWNTSWSFGSRVAATRATSAGVWVSWACAAALLLARCLAAPDFELKRTGVYLVKDPKQKILPHLQKQKTQSQRHSNRSPNSSPRKDTASINSEPTATTELVTASVEHATDSTSTSATVTPEKTRARSTQHEEGIEMTYNPK